MTTQESDEREGFAELEVVQEVRVVVEVVVVEGQSKSHDDQRSVDAGDRTGSG